LTLAALELDRHVLCEARMAMGARQAHEMLSASLARPHLVAQVVPSPYSLKFDRTIQRLIAEGYLGEVLAVEVFDQGAFADENGPLHWRHNLDLSGLLLTQASVLKPS
jgi:predicted dehydrogenase